MTFKMVVAVPCITPAAIAEMEKMVPGLSSVVEIPVVITPEQVEKTAKEMGNKLLLRNEYVSRVESVKVSSVGGWNVELVIAGD